MSAPRRRALISRIWMMPMTIVASVRPAPITPKIIGIVSVSKVLEGEAAWEAEAAGSALVVGPKFVPSRSCVDEVDMITIVGTAHKCSWLGRREGTQIILTSYQCKVSRFCKNGRMWHFVSTTLPRGLEGRIMKFEELKLPTRRAHFPFHFFSRGGWRLAEVRWKEVAVVQPQACVCASRRIAPALHLSPPNSDEEVHVVRCGT